MAQTLSGAGLGRTFPLPKRDVENFEEHVRGPAFRRILAVIEFAGGPPKVEIDEVSSRRGFELIEEILGQRSAIRSTT